ncbi:MAG: hypothetical protein BGO98_03340 [Myxococcales bacterium 68-20]|nr:MAG: hypothetical protein BGO98_03340 [Myxococcales bacterium 68-20]
MSRADLLALTPASVAALANLGLVKRAQREIESGKGPELDEDDAGVVTGRFEDGVVTKLPPGVLLRDAPCTCGSTAVCRHRVAIVLAYPAWHAGPGAKREPAPAPPVEAWSPSCFTDEQLTALVGKRVMTRAQTILRAGTVVELEGGAAPVARLPTCAVRFHVPRDLGYARCDCQAALACEHVVVAAWAFRQADAAGTPAPCTIELGAKPAGTTAGRDAPLDEALRLAEHVIVEGVAHLGDADKQRFAGARASLSKAGLLWPGTLVDDLEIALEAYRARSARYRTSEVVSLLASLEARARAAKSGAALPSRFVLGSDEARETLLDHVRLMSLGARIEADGDRREASVYLADPDSGVVLVASRAFPPPASDGEPEEGPALARRALTGRVTLGALARGQLVTRTAKRHANHTLTLGTTRTAQTSVAPSSGDWDCLPANLLVRDLDALAEDLRSRPPRLLRPRTLAAQMKVLALPPEGAVLEVAYRPGDQELIAVLGLTDPTTGNTGRIHLVRRHSRTGPSALDAIAKALQSTTPAPRFVAGDVRFGPRGLEIDPTAIVTDRVIVPDLETEPPMVESLPLLAPRKEPPFHAAIALAATLLEEALHDGLAHLRVGFIDRALHAAGVLGAVGLGGAQRRVLALREAVSSGNADAARIWLDAAVRLELTRDTAFA